MRQGLKCGVGYQSRPVTIETVNFLFPREQASAKRASETYNLHRRDGVHRELFHDMCDYQESNNALRPKQDLGPGEGDYPRKTLRICKIVGPVMLLTVDPAEPYRGRSILLSTKKKLCLQKGFGCMRLPDYRRVTKEICGHDAKIVMGSVDDRFSQDLQLGDEPSSRLYHLPVGDA